MTIIKFNGKTYVEQDACNPVMTEFTCSCGNQMTVPLGGVELGLTTSCNHCTSAHGFPRELHESSITHGWIGLIEDETEVDLDID